MNYNLDKLKMILYLFTSTHMCVNINPNHSSIVSEKSQNLKPQFDLYVCKQSQTNGVLVHRDRLIEVITQGKIINWWPSSVHQSIKIGQRMYMLPDLRALVTKMHSLSVIIIWNEIKWSNVLITINNAFHTIPFLKAGPHVYPISFMLTR